MRPRIRKRRRRDLDTAIREKIILYFLSRAALGCDYNIEVTDRPPQKGYYSTFKDNKGHYHSPDDMIYLSKEQKDRLIQVLCSGFSLPGVSITDLVNQRDSNCAGIFRYLKVTRKDAKKILDELVDGHLLVAINKNNPLEHETETRYKIANASLSNYICDHYGLLFDVLERMELTWILDQATRKETEWYEYYYGMPQIVNFFDNIKYRNKKYKLYNNARKSRMEGRIKDYDIRIRRRIEAIKNEITYNDVRAKYPFLVLDLKKIIEPIRNRVKMYNDFYNF